MAQNEAEARQLESLLPVSRTPQFVQSDAELQDFQTRLLQATPRAFVTPAIMVINVLVFIAMVVAGAGLIALPGDTSSNPLAINPEAHVRWGANFGPLTGGGQWWRLLTSAFLHFGVLHLLFNMWALHAAGQMVERLYGNVFFIILYLGAAVTGGLASVLWHPQVISAGASGAIFGVYGALLAYVLRQRASVAPSILPGLRKSGFAFVGYNLLYGGFVSGIDNAAHVGGLFGGAAIGLALARPLDLGARTTVSARRAFAGSMVALILPTLMWLPMKNSAKASQAEQRLNAELKWFAEEERSIVTGWENTRAKARAVREWDSEAALVLDRAVRRWQNAQDRMAALDLEDDPASSNKRAKLLKYIGLRRDAMKALSDGMTQNSRLKLEECKSLEAEAAVLVRQMSPRNRPRDQRTD